MGTSRLSRLRAARIKPARASRAAIIPRRSANFFGATSIASAPHIDPLLFAHCHSDLQARRRRMTRLLIGLATLAFGAAVLVPVASAAERPTFKGKTITMIIGYAPGGGTDLSGRLLASFLGKYLPGEPTIVVQNIPGADGMTAMNFFV